MHLRLIWQKSGLGSICGFTESEDLTILTYLYVQMWGLDDKIREEKRNKGMPWKEKIGRDAVVTIPILLYGYTDNFTLLSVVYIRGIKSSNAKGMGYWGGRSFLLCISKAASRHNCSSKLGKFCSRFAFAFTAKIISDARWWGGYKPPHRIYKWRDSCDTRRYETGLFEHKNALYLG